MKTVSLLLFPTVLLLAACTTTPDLQRQGPEALVTSADYQLSVGNIALAHRRAWYAYSDAEKAGNEKVMGEALIVLAKIDRLIAADMLDKQAFTEKKGYGSVMSVVKVETSDPAEIDARFRRAVEKVTEAIVHLEKAGSHDLLALAHAERAFSYSALKEKDAECADYDAALKEYDLAIAADPSVTFPIYSPHGSMTFPELIRFYREHGGCEGTDGAK